MRTGSSPWWMKKRWSSTASSASIIVGDTRSSGTSMRCSTKNVKAGLPCAVVDDGGLRRRGEFGERSRRVELGGDA